MYHVSVKKLSLHFVHISGASIQMYPLGHPTRYIQSMVKIPWNRYIDPLQASQARNGMHLTQSILRLYKS